MSVNPLIAARDSLVIRRNSDNLPVNCLGENILLHECSPPIFERFGRSLGRLDASNSRGALSAG